MTADSAPETEFSAMQLFNMFEKAIAKINTNPLVPKNITVHSEVMHSPADANPEAFRPFATFESDRQAAAQDLQFGVGFGADGLVFDCEHVGAFYLGYSTFKNEKDCLSQLLDALRMLTSGQIAVLVTSYDGLPCATEIILYEHAHSHPRVIGTDASFPKIASKNDDGNYELTMFRNTGRLKYIEPPLTSFMYDRRRSGALMIKGRILKDKPTPLTKGQYKQMLEDVVQAEREQNPDIISWDRLILHWEFWPICLLITTLVYGLWFMHLLPKFFLENPAILVPVVCITSGVLTGHFLTQKNARRENLQGSRYMRFDRIVESSLSKLRSSLPRKDYSSGRTKLLSAVLIGICYASGILVGIAGVIFMRTLSAHALRFGSSVLFGSVMLIASAITLLLTNRFRLKQLRETTFSWLVALLAMASMLPLALALKDGAASDDMGSIYGWAAIGIGWITLLSAMGFWAQVERRAQYGKYS